MNANHESYFRALAAASDIELKATIASLACTRLLDEINAERREVQKAQQQIASYRQSPAARGHHSERDGLKHAIEAAEFAVLEHQARIAAAEAAHAVAREEQQRLCRQRDSTQRVLAGLREEIERERRQRYRLASPCLVHVQRHGEIVR